MYFKKNSSFMIRDITSSCGDFCNLILASISILNDFLIILGIFVLIVYLQGFGLFITMFIFFVICSLFYFLLKKKFKSWGEKIFFFWISTQIFNSIAIFSKILEYSVNKNSF